MVTAKTEGVLVTIETEYQPEYSSPRQQHFVFTYRVKIENNSDYTFHLLRRKWEIFDSNGVKKEVEGEGVVGQQPVLEPGEMHQYVSGSNLKTSMGKMSGYYLMERMIDGKKLQITIPEFILIAPFRLNWKAALAAQQLNDQR